VFLEFRQTAEQIIRKIKTVEQHISQWKTIAEVFRIFELAQSIDPPLAAVGVAPVSTTSR